MYPPRRGRQASGKLNATWASSGPADVFEFGGLDWASGLVIGTAAGFVDGAGRGLSVSGSWSTFQGGLSRRAGEDLWMGASRRGDVRRASVLRIPDDGRRGPGALEGWRGPTATPLLPAAR